LTTGDVELAAVTRTLDRRPVELALGERALHMRAHVVERVQVALDVRDGHLALPHAERGHLALGHRARRTDLHPLRHGPAPLPSVARPGRSSARDGSAAAYRTPREPHPRRRARMSGVRYPMIATR